jgi:hypothetical protein
MIGFSSTYEYTVLFEPTLTARSIIGALEDAAIDQRSNRSIPLQQRWARNKPVSSTSITTHDMLLGGLHEHQSDGSTGN